MKTLISLIGEQPMPNLLPILFFKPDKNILLYSDLTESGARKLEKLLSNSDKAKVDAYDIDSIKKQVLVKIQDSDDFIFNITGGTKLMSLALFQVALERKIKFIYFQSEENQSVIFDYNVTENGLSYNKITLSELLNNELYLKAHLFDFTVTKTEKSSGADFENLICQTLKTNGFEVLQNIKPVGEGNQLEIDAVLRLKGSNNVGIAEIKVGDAAGEGPKKGIDQLALASQREYLGTYTKRFLITSRELQKPIKDLAKAHKINIIDGIETERQRNSLTRLSEQKLIDRIKEKLM